MFLSDAILKGCEIRPHKARCTLWSIGFDSNQETVYFSSCVLGAAYDGTFGPMQIVFDKENHKVTFLINKDEGMESSDHVMNQLRKVYPQLSQLVRAEIKDCDFRTLETTLTNMNDSKVCLWTREQIAAWVKYVVEGAPMIPED